MFPHVPFYVLLLNSLDDIIIMQIKRYHALKELNHGKDRQSKTRTARDQPLTQTRVAD